MNLSIADVRRYVGLLQEICKGTPTIDAHAHATEVTFDEIRYQSLDEPVMSVSGAECYKPVVPAPIRLSDEVDSISSRFVSRIGRMSIDRCYQFSGPQVMLDQMEVAGIDHSVLLPVAHKDHAFAWQMDVLDAFRRYSSRFIAGYCVHDSVADADIADDLRAAKESHAVRVVKVHTNFSDIDIGSRAGVERVNAIIRACGAQALPIVFHGGESPVLGESPARHFGIADNLRKLDWAATDYPVVIAHFGVYGGASRSGEVSEPLVSTVTDMLARHQHMYLDTSGVSYTTILRMLGVVDPSRLVFGSDAYYVPLYRQVALVLHAFVELGMDLDIIRDMASRNALRILGLNS